jgi:hypothetical protein
MMITRILVACVLAGVGSLPAFGECFDEAVAARERIWTAGPFRFDSTRWDRNGRTRTCGEIDPGRAQREGSCEGAATVSREKVWIATQRWENDGLGWRGPVASLWTHQEKVPAAGVSFQANQVTCFGRVIVAGRELNGYAFATRLPDRISSEMLFTDVDTDIPVRFETRGRSDAASGSVTTFHHDASIRIEPPTVDSSARWSASLGQVAREAQKGEPVCRAEFLAVMERAKATPFHFEIKGAFDSYPCCMNGSFAPPDSLHYQIEGNIGRVGPDVLAVGQRAWVHRASPRAWIESSRGRDEANQIIASLLPTSDHVGHVRCLGRIAADAEVYDAYEFDFYRDRESARKFDGVRAMLVSPATRLPVQTTHMSRSRERRWVETRSYDSALRIEEPKLAATHDPPLRSPPLPYSGGFYGIVRPGGLW